MRSRAAALLFPVALGVLGLSLCRAGAISAASDTVAPSDPSKLHATAASGVQVNLSWTASTDNVGVTGYLLERCQRDACSSFTLIASPATATFSDTTGLPATAYSYRVRAADASGNLSGYSNIANVITLNTLLPSAPSNLTATSSNPMAVNLSWNSSTDNSTSSYFIERCQGVACSSFLLIASVPGPVDPRLSSTYYTDAGVTSSSSYSYRVRATNGSNLSVYSNTATVMTPATPTGVFYPQPPRLRGLFAGGAPASVITGQSYTGSAQLLSHTTAAFDSTGGDLIVVLGSTHEAVAALSLTDNKGNTWVSAAGPTNHSSPAVDMRTQLWYAKAPNVGTGHTVTLNLSTPNSLLVSVLVIKGSNTTMPIDVISNITDNGGSPTNSPFSQSIQLKQPGDLLIDFAASDLSVTWIRDDTLESAASSSYLAAGDGLARSLDNYNTHWTTNLAANWQNVLLGIVSANVSFSDSQVTVAWDNAGGATGYPFVLPAGYLILRCSSSTSAHDCSLPTQIASTGPNIRQYTDTTVSPGTWYTYHVEATTEDARYYNFSPAGYVATTGDVTPPTAPANLTATASSTTQINLSYTRSTDNISNPTYLYERCQGIGCTDFAQVDAGLVGGFDGPGLLPGTSYTFRIRAKDAAGNLSAYSNTASATTFTGPGNLTAAVSGGTQINLSWTASPGAVNYLIERCAINFCNPSDYVQFATSITTTYSDTGLTSGWYIYRVRAIDANSTLSAYSNFASGLIELIPPSDPSNLIATAVSISIQPSNGIKIQWTKSLEKDVEPSYYVERCQGAGCTSFVQIAAVGFLDDPYFDGGLLPSTSYSYRVRAFDQAGNLSGYSNTASATTVAAAPDTTGPSAPLNLTAAAASSTQIHLSWAAATDNVGVTGYLLERCQGVACFTFAQIASPAITSYTDTGLTPAGSYSYEVRATDAAGNFGGYSDSATAITSNTTLSLSPSTLPAGTAGIAYNQTLTASGGTGPYSFTVAGGSLPTGLTLSSTGALTGTPTTSGTATFTVQALDSLGNPGTQPYTVSISAVNSSNVSLVLAGRTYDSSPFPGFVGRLVLNFALTNNGPAAAAPFFKLTLLQKSGADQNPAQPDMLLSADNGAGLAGDIQSLDIDSLGTGQSTNVALVVGIGSRQPFSILADLYAVAPGAAITSSEESLKGLHDKASVEQIPLLKGFQFEVSESALAPAADRSGLSSSDPSGNAALIGNTALTTGAGSPSRPATQDRSAGPPRISSRLSGATAGSNVGVMTRPGAQSRPSLAIDPIIPTHMAVASNDYGSGAVRVSTTQDGGQTWQSATLSKTVLNQNFYSAQDPSIAFDSLGRLSVVYTLSNVNDSANAIVLSESSDGINFNPPSAISFHLASDSIVDSRPVIAIKAGVGRYVAWDRLSTTTFRYSIHVVRSEEGGLFGPVTTVISNSLVSSPALALGSSTVYLGWDEWGFNSVTPFRTGGRLMITSSPSRAQFNFALPHEIATTSIGFAQRIPAMPDVGVGPDLSIAVDPQRDDVVHAVFTDRGNGMDIRYGRSIDRGRTWRMTTVNNDDPLADRFTPAIALDSYGNLNIVFYDTRRSSTFEAADVFLAQPSDSSFSNQRISTASSDDSRKNPLRDFTADLGGRMAIGISAGNAVIVWTDTRLGSEAIFLSIVPNTESAPTSVCTVGRKTCRAGRPQR